jgi:hypothetical protein
MVEKEMMKIRNLRVDVKIRKFVEASQIILENIYLAEKDQLDFKGGLLDTIREVSELSSQEEWDYVKRTKKYDELGTPGLLKELVERVWMNIYVHHESEAAKRKR